MDAIVLAFAHSKESPLPALEQECEELSSLLLKNQRKHYSIVPIEYADRAKIAGRLSDLRSDISVFMYSGHADSESLLLHDEEASAEGLANLLRRCPKLRLVILNGCNTEDQVDELLKLGDFAVVATNDHVGDDNAKNFSIELFRSLVEGDTLGQAFEHARSVAWNDKHTLHRGYRPGWEKSNTSPESKWGLFTTSEGASILDWKLIRFDRNPEFKVNTYLISSLFEALSEHNEEARRIKTNEEMGVETGISVKTKVIIDALPALIRRQVGRLLVPPEENEHGDFFNEPGLNRLKELLSTYKVTTDLLAAAFISQLWTLCESEPVRFSDAELTEIRYYLIRPGEMEELFNSALFIRMVRQILNRYDVKYFIEEMHDLDAYELDTPLITAVSFYEGLKVKIGRLTTNEAAGMCEEAEMYLAQLLSRVGFLAKYTMLSVRDIDVFKYRHISQPLFTYSGLDNDPKSFVMDRRSVLLTRHHIDGDYLNLSPFIIDVNSFPDERTRSVSDINKPKRFASYYKYDKEKDQFTYRDIGHKATALRAGQGTYIILRRQLEAFAKLIFKKPISEV